MRLRTGYFFVFLFLVVSAGAAPAPEPPVFTGVVRGVVLECDPHLPTGEFSLRVHVSNQVYRFNFDSKTYVEDAGRRISMNELQKGDTVEVVSDRDATIAVHYARTVHIIEVRLTPRTSLSHDRQRAYRSTIDLIAPRGDMTFAGIIAKLAADRLILRTRMNGEKIILLRRDTRYLEGGTLVDASELKPNTRIFIRAGKNLDDQVEAYQVIWGEILEPNGPR